jgi:membrane protein required for colicin V production
MTLFDYVVLGIMGLSVLLSIWRGVVRELLALAAWVVAFLVAQFYAVALAAYVPAAVGSTELRTLTAFLVVFILVLIAMGLLAIAVSRLIHKAGLGLSDRVLGAVFGLVRGVLIVLIGVLAAGLTALPRERAWREAALSAPLEALALAVKPWLPADFGSRIRYD